MVSHFNESTNYLLLDKIVNKKKTVNKLSLVFTHIYFVGIALQLACCSQCEKPFRILIKILSFKRESHDSAMRMQLSPSQSAHGVI